jgi:hypothetical protein
MWFMAILVELEDFSQFLRFTFDDRHFFIAAGSYTTPASEVRVSPDQAAHCNITGAHNWLVTQ